MHTASRSPEIWTQNLSRTSVDSRQSDSSLGDAPSTEYIKIDAMNEYSMSKLRGRRSGKRRERFGGGGGFGVVMCNYCVCLRDRGMLNDVRQLGY